MALKPKDRVFLVSVRNESSPSKVSKVADEGAVLQLVSEISANTNLSGIERIVSYEFGDTTVYEWEVVFSHGRLKLERVPRPSNSKLSQDLEYLEP